MTCVVVNEDGCEQEKFDVDYKSVPRPIEHKWIIKLVRHWWKLKDPLST